MSTTYFASCFPMEAVNKRKSVGTIAYYFIEALDCPLPSNEAIAHAYTIYYALQKRVQ